MEIVAFMKNEDAFYVSNVLLCMTGGQENRNSLKFSLHVKYKIGRYLESKLCVELLFTRMENLHFCYNER